MRRCAAAAWARAVPATTLRVSAHRALDHFVIKQYRFTPPPHPRQLRAGGEDDNTGEPASTLDGAAVKEMFDEYAAVVEEQYGVRLTLARVTAPAPAADGAQECTVHYHVAEDENTAFSTIQPAESTAHFLNANTLLSEMKTSAERVACGTAYTPGATVRMDAPEAGGPIRIKCRDGVFAVRDGPDGAFRTHGSDPLDEVKHDNKNRQEMELQDRTRAWQEQAGAAAPPQEPLPEEQEPFS